ncbi:hypothetical protein ACQEWB_25075 [Streptomyces sp. CA-249302]|uniref:hypothetical protein n=1 Tax=Streptomyces sp. CA-249302 TaxID=3240058 RepID=UPI003D90F776
MGFLDRKVCIQVLPFAAGQHASLVGIHLDLTNARWHKSSASPSVTPRSPPTASAPSRRTRSRRGAQGEIGAYLRHGAGAVVVAQDVGGGPGEEGLPPVRRHRGLGGLRDPAGRGRGGGAGEGGGVPALRGQDGPRVVLDQLAGQRPHVHRAAQGALGGQVRHGAQQVPRQPAGQHLAEPQIGVGQPDTA